jgi:hypothetical protein
MRAALVTTVLAAAIAVAGAGTAVAGAPTPRQVQRAVRTAETSRSLWATVNICNSPGHPDEIGIRGQMPALGFTSTMSMTIQLNAWSKTTRSFAAIQSPNAVNDVPVGAHSRGLEQSGSVFPFHKGQKGLWDATIVFTWKRAGRTLGQTQRTTAAGHPDADFGSPPHHSAAQCRIG